MADRGSPLARAFVAAALLLVPTVGVAQDAPKAKPVFRDFMGLNVHTVQFKPELYRPVARRVRDYHPFSWDVGDETDFATTFPFARNRVDWGTMYGDWAKAGYGVHVSVMFDDTPPAKWKDLPRDARAYGLAFARAFGPSGERKAVESVEVGNEPGKYDDASYRTLFENAARGFREGDPKLLVATCAVFAKPSGEYHKSVETVKGLDGLYDVLNVHSYAQLEGWPTWRRSFPEDDRLAFLKDVTDVIAWRDANAPGKRVWLTEFGWDAATKPPAADGPFKDWVGVTDAQQARYLVRAFLVLSELDLDRASVYWFNDKDEPSLHAASGLTRNDQPKPSFHAVAHLLATFGDHRFARVVAKRPGDLYVYEFEHEADPSRRIWAVWSPTGSDRTTEARLPIPADRIEKAERMPFAAGKAEAVDFTAAGGETRIEIGESPVYFRLKF